MSKFTLLYFLFILISCSQKEYKTEENKILVNPNTSSFESSNAGNLITSSIRKVHDLDVVFYPKKLMKEDVALLETNKRELNVEDILNIYPQGPMDQFYVGNMKGKDIEKFLKQRILETYDAELEVAGLMYRFLYKGGFPVSFSVTKNDRPLKKDEYYKVAISKFYTFSGETFPSYRFRNSIDRIFQKSFKEISARQSLKDFLLSDIKIPRLSKVRAKVEHVKSKNLGFKSISQIQGKSHLSKYLGNIVKTTGVVTAVSDIDWYPGGMEVYIQSSNPDQNPKTSEAICVYFPNSVFDIEVGDELEIIAEVFENYNLETKLSNTQLRNIKKYRVLSKNNELPAPILLGNEGRVIPQKHISTYFGNINQKTELKLTDTLDFYESLEGMRVLVKDLTVVGFRGGMESSDPFDKKPHLTLYTTIRDNRTETIRTLSQVNGVIPNPKKHLWNPDLLTLASNPLSPFLDSKVSYNVGDKIDGKLTGIFHYNKNIFGGGEYTLSFPKEQESLKKFSQKKRNKMSDCLDKDGLTTLSCRPKVSDKQGNITVASYNLKNLSGIEDLRIEQTGKMISENLNCPDIIGLVEVQDNNGLDFTGGSSAELTLKKIIEATTCHGKNYEAVSIAPDLHNEGGQPGGNIQVAIIYDALKLSFNSNPLMYPFQETSLNDNGDLTFNPGRVFPNDKVYKRTRRSMVAQFKYGEEDFFVIVNHFNSKLGDSNHWSAEQPVVKNSEIKRGKLAYKVNEFVSLIEHKNPKANILVMGDFNAYLNEAPMKILEGNLLYNLMRTIPKNMRYTTNHNGNSGPLDYIFVNKNLKRKLNNFEVLHLNSNYMGRLSDHDPIHASFD